jgi:hypothetical protein
MVPRWDLVCEGLVGELIETQHFTDPASIFRAVVYGCRHSHHESKAGKGYITIGQARHIMRELGPCEPDDRAAVIRQFCAPSLCRQDSGSEFWPINIGPGIVAEEQAWAVIHGIEDGWFAHDRAGFLQWTQLGGIVSPLAQPPVTPRRAAKLPSRSDRGRPMQIRLIEGLHLTATNSVTLPR